MTATPATRTFAGTVIPVSVAVGNAGVVVLSTSGTGIALIAAIPSAGVRATVTSRTTDSFSVVFSALAGAGSVPFTAGRSGSTITYRIG